jgi:hypothetical protein
LCLRHHQSAFYEGARANERAINEFLDQAVTALQSPTAGVRHAAMNAVNHFADMGLVYRTHGALGAQAHGWTCCEVREEKVNRRLIFLG